MDHYEPPYTLTPKILELVAQIVAKITSITINSTLEYRPHLRRSNRIKSIHASLKIEANSLSLNQVEDVIAGRTVLGPLQEIQEVKNAYAAYAQLTDINPYSVQDLLHLHGILTQYLVAESGSFRSGEEGVFADNKCIFMAPPARFVPALIKQLFTWMQNSKVTLHPLVLAAVFHYEFVFIHPFTDGNGRLARLWHTALLAQWQPLFAYIPLESQIEKFQQGYYDAIAYCHKQGNSTYFVEFILEQIKNVLDDVITESARSALALDAHVQRLLDIMEPEIPYATTELMQKLQLKSRVTFRQHYLLPALEQHLVKMTIPEKPTSRNQRYMKISG